VDNISNFYKSKMADGRHFEKPLNHHNSATVQQISMKSGMTHFDPLKPSDEQKFYLKKQDGRRLMPGHVCIDTKATQ